MTIDSASDGHQESSSAFEPFDIVLVDLHVAANENRIHCVRKKLAPGTDLKYVAISYRWGELDETVVPAVDYNAHITSFEQEHFQLLCEIFSKEVDLQLMQYVWVDAICVDQANETRRKETIYHMNDIYEYANWIVAVPDLHLGHLKKDRVNYEVLEWIDANAACLYYIIKNNGVGVESMLDQYMSHFIDVPDNLRCYLSTSVYKLPKTDTRKREAKNKKRTRVLFEKLVLPGTPEDIEQITVDGRLVNSNGWSSILCPPSSVCTEENSKKEILQRQFDMVFQISKWQRAIDERHQKLKRAFAFLESVVKDWSTRAWVISEYNIAKKKNNKVLKYCFVSFGWVYRLEAPTESDVRLFEIDFKNECNIAKVTRQELQYPLTFDCLHEGFTFRRNIQDMMVNTSFLDMFLRSRASKNIDRFHAILPLSKEYSHYIKNSNTINQWKITDMVSVRMKVRQWFTVEENIHLLFFRHYPNTVSVPSFDHNMNGYDPASVRSDISNYCFTNKYQCNFDLDPNKPAVILMDNIDNSGENHQPRYYIHIFPIVYGIRSIVVHQDIYSAIPKTTWQKIQLDPSVDELTHLCIPLRIFHEYHSCEKDNNIALEGTPVLDLLEEDKLHLVGSHDKNIWIVVDGFYLSLIDKDCVSSATWSLYQCDHDTDKNSKLSANWVLYHHRHDGQEPGLRIY